jgi:hypothetical protein
MIEFDPRNETEPANGIEYVGVERMLIKCATEMRVPGSSTTRIREREKSSKRISGKGCRYLTQIIVPKRSYESGTRPKWLTMKGYRG